MLHVYTYSTSPEKVQFLMESAKLHNLSIENLSTTLQWTNFRDKLNAMQKKIDSLPRDDIVCFLDAYDILVNAPSEKIIESFKKMNTDILFGAEIILWPPKLHELKDQYPESPTPFRFLNSGCYIGYVHAIQEMLSWSDFGDDDQEYCNKYFLQHRTTKQIKLDTHAEFVLNMQQVPWQTLNVENGVIFFLGFNTTPCFLHFCGMSYMDVEKDFVELGDNKRGFTYGKVYSRTFLALITAKFISERSPLRLQLTSNGHTYPLVQPQPPQPPPSN